MDRMPDLPEIKKGIYQHFKGGKYEVLGVVHHSETLEILVLYKHLGDNSTDLWVRPYDMFVEDIEHDGRKPIPRFRYTGE